MKNKKEKDLRFNNHVIEVEEKLKSLDGKITNNKMSYKDYNYESCEILSRFCHLWDRTNYSKTKIYKKMSKKLWRLGSE